MSNEELENEEKARWFGDDPNRLQRSAPDCVESSQVGHPSEELEQDERRQFTPYLIAGAAFSMILCVVLFLLSQSGKTKPIFQDLVDEKIEASSYHEEWEQEFEASFRESRSRISKHLLPQEVAENFTQAMDPKERLQWCRNQDDVALLLSSFPEQALKEVPDSIEKMGEISTGSGLYFHHFAVYFANGDRRLLVLVHTEDGPRVDWETYARHTSESWTDILDGRVNQALVRVFIKPSNYYNYNYSDEEEWASFSITSPDLEETITAYCERNSLLGRKLGQVSRNQRVTLRLACNQANIQSRQ